MPALSFAIVDGRGDPNSAPAFEEAVQALYAVAYGAKFALKRGAEQFDYAVMPLEGLWPDAPTSPKADWEWTLMIMQPDQVTSAIFEEARAKAVKKRPSGALGRIRLERFSEGLAAQVMYVGPYGDEGPAIAQLHAFIADQGYEPSGFHHEIYLGDPRRVAPAKLKTIIRQPVAASRGVRA